MSTERPSELLALSLELWHPDCWALRVTEETDAGLLGYGAITDDSVARERYVAYGDTDDHLDQLVASVAESPFTSDVQNVGPAASVPRGCPAIGTTTREIFVTFDAPNSIDSAFTSRGFVYDDLPQMADGRERWSLLVDATRDDVGRMLDAIREERDADITVTGITTIQSESMHAGEKREQRLSPRQREALELARARGYYEWPRGVSIQELADEIGVSKTTFLEHLRRAESKLLDPP